MILNSFDIVNRATSFISNAAVPFKKVTGIDLDALILKVKNCVRSLLMLKTVDLQKDLGGSDHFRDFLNDDEILSAAYETK